MTLDGVPVGTAEMSGAPRAIGRLTTAGGYAESRLRTRALALGTALRLVGWDRVDGAIASRVLAGAIAHMALLQDRLGLRDEHGRSVGIVHIVVVEFPRDRDPIVVAQLREQAAPVASGRRAYAAHPGDQSRPAA